MAIKLTMVALALLIVVAVDLTNAYPHSDAHMLTMKANSLASDLQNIKLMGRRKMQEMCYNVTGSNSAFWDAELAQERAQLCIQMVVNDAVRAQPYSYYRYPMSKEDQIVDAIKAVCTKKEGLIQCQSDYVKVANKCLDAKEKKKLKKSVEGFEDLIDYVCANDAERVTSFVDNGGVACFNRNLNGLLECVNNFVDGFKSLTNSESPVTATYDEVAGCKKAITFFKCFVDKMKTCDNQTPANIIEGLVDQAISSVAICGGDDETSKTETTTKAKSDVVDVV